MEHPTAEMPRRYSCAARENSLNLFVQTLCAYNNRPWTDSSVSSLFSSFPPLAGQRKISLVTWYQWRFDDEALVYSPIFSRIKDRSFGQKTSPASLDALRKPILTSTSLDSGGKMTNGHSEINGKYTAVKVQWRTLTKEFYLFYFWEFNLI